METDNTAAVSRIGILGGTFDPVHLGHINLALDCREKAELDRVLFMPARLQPFKLDKKITSGEDRLNMLKEALADLEGLEASSYELDTEGISYTYLTIRAMREIYGSGTRIYFIMGTDTFLKIETWKNAHKLLKSCSYLVGSRPGYRQGELRLCMEKIRREYGTEVINIENRQYDVSSTEIRHRIENDIPCTDLIPERVERYIRQNELYKG